ncbi:hypothetical protein ABC383_07900 [Noviherbaspirillum sp. 1P10PC]|uniref:hypothetical protein n=1 Tax=Noviherbaspirillum sp. 1P10PC TaxID=3132292 RepID=UPI0039A3EDE0
MKPDVFYRFSPRALEAIGKQGIKELPRFDSGAVPLPGDSLTLEYLPGLVFIVEQRRFHWISHDSLQIHLGIDLHTAADNWVRTGKHL